MGWMILVFLLLLLKAAYWLLMSCVVGVLTRVILKKKNYAHGCFALIRLGIVGCILGGFFKVVVLMRHFNYFSENGPYSFRSILFDLVFSLSFALIVNLIYDGIKKK